MAAILALLLGGLAGWGATLALERLLLFRDPRGEPPPCFDVGSPFHHRFRPACQGWGASPRGPVLFRINEDGLREVPRAAALTHKRRVALLGDSFVEGWWLGNDETLSSELTARGDGVFFLNAGLRSTGPLMQAARLREVLRLYKPRGVLWVLNDTDLLDDRFTCAVARDPSLPAERLELDTPEFSEGGWHARAAALFGDSPVGAGLRRLGYQERWKALAAVPGRCAPCRGVEEVKRVAAEAGTPLMALYVGTGALSAHYAGAEKDRQALQGCLRAAGVEFHEELLGNELLFEGDFHPSPDGISALAGKIEPWLKAWEGGLRGK